MSRVVHHWQLPGNCFADFSNQPTTVPRQAGSKPRRCSADFSTGLPTLCRQTAGSISRAVKKKIQFCHRGTVQASPVSQPSLKGDIYRLSWRNKILVGFSTYRNVDMFNSSHLLLALVACCLTIATTIARPFVLDCCVNTYNECTTKCDEDFWKFGHSLVWCKLYCETQETYPCKVCHETFSKACRFKNQQKTHSGEKPYPCTVCHRHIPVKNVVRHFLQHVGSGINKMKINSPHESL